MKFLNKTSALLLGSVLVGCLSCKSEPAAPKAPEAPTVSRLQLVPVVTGLHKPVFVTAPAGVSDRLYVVEQKSGVVHVIDPTGKKLWAFVDLSDRIEKQGGEQGLLGLAFHPRFPQVPRAFLAFTAEAPDGTDRNVVAAYRLDADGKKLDPASEEVLLSLKDPASNHNGGMLAFGPDGYLYIGTGDGGGGGDTYGTSRDMMSLHAKMLRIDVDKKGKDRPYGIPPDNPFVNKRDIRPEIWASGLRNPWRYSFDRERGDLFVADVGQNKYEEVNFQPRDSKGGEDYGWNVMEASHCFVPQKGCKPHGLTAPLVEYDHKVGCSITGGYVYRGQKVSALRGTYLYADYCSGEIWALEAVLGARADAPVKERHHPPEVVFARKNLHVSSFGEDGAGELYVVDHSGVIYQVVGFTPRK